MNSITKIPARLGRFQVSYEFLLQGLDIPETARVITVQPDSDGRSFTVIVMDESLEEVTDEHFIPKYIPVMTATEHDCGHRIVTWDWRKPVE